MKKTRTQEGITLVALIITIIVLLILAGVAITSVQDSDIITHAKNAKEDYIVAQEKERIQLALNGWFIEKETSTEPSAYKSYLERELSDVATVTGEETLVITFNEIGNQYLLNENWEQVTTVTDLEKYIFGQDLVGRTYTDILSLVDPNLYSFVFLNDEVTSINEEEKIIYSDIGIEEKLGLENIYFKYEDEFYKFAINNTGTTDVNYGLIKLPKVDTSNYTVLEKYMFGEHGQGRDSIFVYNDDDVFMGHPTTIPNASTELITLGRTIDGLLYFKYEDNIYSVAIDQSTDKTDVNYGLVKLDKLEEETKVGKIVEYDGVKWTILYDDDTNGLQMIRNTTINYSSLESLNNLIYDEEEVKIADLNQNKSIDTDGIEGRLYAYNMAIELLNKACDDKVLENENIIEVRCVGSNPVSKNSENNTRYTSDELKEWPINNDTYPSGIINGIGKSSDQNYISDYERMLLLRICESDNDYWLASRRLNVSEKGVSLCVYQCHEYYVDGIREVGIDKSGIGGTGAGSHSGLRPVVKLKQDVVFSGSGTDADPYTF